MSSYFLSYSGFVEILLLILVSSSFLSSTISVENLLCSMVSFSFLSSVGFVKNLWSVVSSFFPLLYRLHQKFPLNYGVLILPILCLHICRLIQKFSAPKVSLSFLSSPLQALSKNDLYLVVLILPLLCRIHQKFALHCGVLILSLLRRTFQISLLILFLLHDHF